MQARGIAPDCSLVHWSTSSVLGHAVERREGKMENKLKSAGDIYLLYWREIPLINIDEVGVAFMNIN